jgi:hypothetical protein
MPESTPLAADSASLVKRVCEKCRNEYTLDHFQHGIQEQDCVCKRCLRVMGYRVK